jgi:hypothetical protein
MIPRVILFWLQEQAKQDDQQCSNHRGENHDSGTVMPRRLIFAYSELRPIPRRWAASFLFQLQTSNASRIIWRSCVSRLTEASAVIAKMPLKESFGILDGMVRGQEVDDCWKIFQGRILELNHDLVPHEVTAKSSQSANNFETIFCNLSIILLVTDQMSTQKLFCTRILIGDALVTQ